MALAREIRPRSCRVYACSLMGVRRPKERAERARQFEQAAGLVEQKLGDPELTLAWVAEQLAVSPRHLQRVFAEQAGMGWRDYLDGQRLDRARAWLEDPALYDKGLSVREVSRTVGYYQPAGFAKAFRRHFGMAPHEVRPRELKPVCAESPR